MGTIQDLNLKSSMAEPKVWVERLAIYATWGANAIPIQDISLGRGVNFVWAEEPARGHGSALSGHSAGKSTFCRFLRYVLGETTFATSENATQIGLAFPDGYVAAEIHVLGRRWAVRRPFGSGKLSYVLADASIEELVADGGHSVSKESYVSELGFESVLAALTTRQVPQDERPLGWANVLAWCSRDQEARFDSLHHWRSTRSDSETPRFAFPKLGALFAIRACMGLLSQQELGHEREVAQLTSEIDRTEAELASAKSEPDTWIGRFNKRLDTWLKSNRNQFWPDLDEGIGGLFSPSPSDAQAAIADEIARLQRELDQVQSRLDELGVEVRACKETTALHQAALRVHQQAVEGVQPAERSDLIPDWVSVRHRRCGYGQVLYGDCEHIQKRIRLIRAEELTDASSREKDEAIFSEYVQEAERELKILASEMLDLEQRQQENLDQRRTLTSALRDQMRLQQQLADIQDGLAEWTDQKLNASVEKVSSLQKQLSDLITSRGTAEVKRQRAADEHKQSFSTIQGLFTGLVRRVLHSEDASGEIRINEKGELVFRIHEGSYRGGEAVRTLSVLTSDLTCLIYACISDQASHPCFLLHDSPREADLSLNLYEDHLLTAMELETVLGGPDQCPFQYVVTTTTPPPQEAINLKKVKLKLDASTVDGLLLKRDVSSMTLPFGRTASGSE